MNRVVFINGSPKKEKSASNKLIHLMSDFMSLQENELVIFYAYDLVRSKEKMNLLWNELINSKLFIPVYPLYVDTLPAALIEVFESLLPYFLQTPQAQLNMSAVANCGFPESEHALVSLENCALFAEAAHVHWLGGLSMGAGPMVLNVPMNPNGAGPLKTAGVALKEACQLLLRGEKIPSSVQAQFGRAHFPVWMYRLIGNLSWFQSKRFYHTQTSLRARPYQKKK